MQGPSPVETGEDPLAPYRGRILYGLASAAAVCLLPFSVNAFVQGNYGLGAGILCAFLVLAIDAFAIYLKKSPPIPLILLLIPIAAGTAVSLAEPCSTAVLGQWMLASIESPRQGRALQARPPVRLSQW